MKYILISLLFILGGCPSSALKGLTPVRVESKRSTPIQLCKATPEFRTLVDKAVLSMLDELDKANLLDKNKVTKSMEDEWPIACMIERPEPCTLTPATCTANHPACARKAGCGHYAGFWVAEYWPPICTERWPDEPHCVNDAAKQRKIGLVFIVVHEVCEMLCARTQPHCDCRDQSSLELQERVANEINQ